MLDIALSIGYLATMNETTGGAGNENHGGAQGIAFTFNYFKQICRSIDEMSPMLSRLRVRAEIGACSLTPTPAAPALSPSP